jgi:type II secretory pathway pseudopilin PulG
MEDNHKNRGMTLVEVVISLLIIMIVFVPLISSFTTASKLSRTAKNNLYASNLASNVMETVKVLGIDGVALQFDPANTNFTIAPGPTDFDEEPVEGYTTSVKTIDGTKYFDSSRGTKPYIYKMTGVKQGTGTYDVSITFSSASYTTETPTGGSALPNDYLYADLSAFNAESTVLINPMSSGTNYDEMVLQYFMQLNDSYYYDEWVTACEAVNNANDAIYRAYEQAYDAASAAGTPLPTMPSVTPLPVLKPSLSKADIKRSLFKTTTVEISKVTDSLSGIKKYKLNSYINYTFNNILINSGGACASPTTQFLTRNYSGYCDDVLSTSLENIFFMYQPLGDVSALSLDDEKVVINNQLPESFHIYLVIQAPATTTVKAKLPVYLSGTSNTLHLYSQVDLAVEGISSASTSNSSSEEDRLLKEFNTDTGRIYDVKINIYESGSGFTKQLQTLSSTILSH